MVACFFSRPHLLWLRLLSFHSIPPSPFLAPSLPLFLLLSPCTEHSELIDEDWDVVNPEDCYRSVGRGERSQSAADIAAPITGGK